MTNVPAASGFSTRNVYSKRSFSIEGAGGAVEGDVGAADLEFPMGGAGEILGVTDVGAPADVPVPTPAMFPGTSIGKTPVKRCLGKSVSGNQRAGSSRYPPSLSMCANCTPSSELVPLLESGPAYSNCSVTFPPTGTDSGSVTRNFRGVISSLS